MSSVYPDDSQGHNWVPYKGVKVCTHCGNVQKKDGKNAACRGKVYVRIR